MKDIKGIRLNYELLSVLRLKSRRQKGKGLFALKKTQAREKKKIGIEKLTFHYVALDSR